MIDVLKKQMFHRNIKCSFWHAIEVTKTNTIVNFKERPVCRDYIHKNTKERAKDKGKEFQQVITESTAFNLAVKTTENSRKRKAKKLSKEFTDCLKE